MRAIDAKDVTVYSGWDVIDCSVKRHFMYGNRVITTLTIASENDKDIIGCDVFFNFHCKKEVPRKTVNGILNYLF